MPVDEEGNVELRGTEKKRQQSKEVAQEDGRGSEWSSKVDL